MDKEYLKAAEKFNHVLLLGSGLEGLYESNHFAPNRG
jgi:hypothetical protein